MIHLRGVMARPQASWAVSQAAAVQARSLLSDTEDRLQQALSSSMVADEVMAAMQGQVAQARVQPQVRSIAGVADSTPSHC